MFTVISPAKRLHEGAVLGTYDSTKPDWLTESEGLISVLRPLGEAEISNLMGISEALAKLNHKRYNAWRADAGPEATRQAVLLFAGDTYTGLDAASLPADDLRFAQGALGILSGLHGLLRPLDRILPYRLEMGTQLTNSRGKNLYQFWGTMIADRIKVILDEHEHKAVVNLASAEYFKAVDKRAFPYRVITPVFKEVKEGRAKVVSFVAKRARGTMARHIIQQRITDPEDLKGFSGMGYSYKPEDSTADAWVYTRPAGTPS